MKLEIEKLCESARYSEHLEAVIDRLGGKELLFLEYESNYQGYVKIDVLLEDSRVYTYEYSYGSCSGCDLWESQGLSNSEIETEMIDGAAIYSSMETYMKGIGAQHERAIIKTCCGDREEVEKI